MAASLFNQALWYLRAMLGPDAAFREGQWEAIQAVVERRGRVLVVERTGWGKSLVYFIATRLLRDQGAGPTLLVSPLLALMRNQVAMSERIGVRSITLNSTNVSDWDQLEAELRDNLCDVLLVSPERLANEHFRTVTLPLIGKGLGMLVVDEAHCISDWGHDFRPDYRRIVAIARNLPSTVPVLGTTATANDRVVEDIGQQLGPGLLIQRGPLTRASLRIQAIRLENQASRMAWLAEHVPELPGSGIIYCLTKADCERVAGFLQSRGIQASAYHSDLEGAVREEREAALLGNRIKALVATVALGMGFDKPDLGFVLHFQRPGSVIAYYQQIGRAGRAVDEAFAVLLSGAEDDEIQEYFIRTAFPSPAEMEQVLDVVERSAGARKTDIERQLNLSRGRIDNALKLLEIEGAVAKQDAVFVRTFREWQPDTERAERVSARRRAELQRMRDFVAHEGCLMEFVARELDDRTARPCGRCANCAGPALSSHVDDGLEIAAVEFLKRSDRIIEPRRQGPSTDPGRLVRVPPDKQLREGRALSFYGDAGWGRLVARGKYVDKRFADDLVEAAVALIERWDPRPRPEWVTAVPSLRRPTLVRDFAERLAARLGLPFVPALVKARKTPEQKAMSNSFQQWDNVQGAVEVAVDLVRPAPVLLVDDVFDSRWTLTICGWRLIEAGCSAVFPFTLADASQYGGDT